MRSATLILTVLLAVPSLAENEDRPIRADRKLGIQFEAGWNGLSGLGVNVNYHVIPMLSLDLGAGLSGVGPKLGARGRLNMGTGNWVPYLGAGVIHAFGTLDQTVDLSDSGSTVTLELLPTQFVQAVFGVEFVASGGFTFGANAGYAFRLRENVRIVSGTPTEEMQQVIDIAYGSGLVLALSLGYTF